ncbi:MAG: 5-formyltetrahydrofolate cyclo-ligase [Thermoprotei archaeon]|nr:MAG: 5-formyltetrahydrofolate cyclo-ligase [Thermoprotei archaeon]
MDEKGAIRKDVWKKLEKFEVAVSPRPCYGKIPNFIGARTAARKILYLDLFKRAKVIFSTPDLPQKYLREYALYRKKTVIVPSQKLKEGFIILDPEKIDKNMYTYASTYRGALRLGERSQYLENITVNLIVVGSVAVTRKGGRLGKGDGFYDLVYAILRELRVIDENTFVVTTVHDYQIVDYIPMKSHDLPVDYIATPSELIIIRTTYRKPQGIIWEKLSLQEIQEIPLLSKLFGK